MGKSLRAIVGRSALVAFGVVLALLALEALLQIGALFTGQGSNTAQGFLSANRRRIVCLGDSNTYGLYVGHDNAYPHFLEEEWNADPGHRPIEVLNLGVSGTNSSGVLAHLNQVLDTFLPDVVLVMIGVNDFWTAPVPVQSSSTGIDGYVATLWRVSRVFRAFYMLYRATQNYAFEYKIEQPGTDGLIRSIVRYGDHEIDLTWAGKRSGQAVPSLIENLSAIKAMTDRAGVELILLTYPADVPGYHYVNDMIRQAAADTHTPLIDLAQTFRALCPNEDCDDLFVFDHHPTVKGHQLAADTIREQWEKSGVR